jgi:hypothetical protein
LLPWGSSLYARVSAINIKGSSLVSDAGNGGVILTQPEPPVNLAEVRALTSYNSVGLTWEDNANDGGSPVIDYRVSYSHGLIDNYVTLESNIESLPYQASGLTVGTTYKFKV